MNILITGASGFIGRHLVQGLLADGHQLSLCVHHHKPAHSNPNIRYIHCDFLHDHSPDLWLDRVRGMDVVINAVGIIRQTSRRSFDALHVKAPIALFEACHKAGVAKVIQVSALGADADAVSAYHRSKKQADDMLRTLPLQWAIVQPSLVYGADGDSAAMFRLLAALPLMPLPAGGRQMIQPVHIDDLVQLVSRIVGDASFTPKQIIASGPEAMTLKAYLQRLRQSMGYGSEVPLALPEWCMTLMAKVGDYIPASPLCSETWGMLQRGNSGADPQFAAQIKQTPRAVDSFIKQEDAASVRFETSLAYMLPVAAFSLAFLWIFSGLISISPWGYDESMHLLASVGLTGDMALLALYTASALDVGLGLAILYHRKMPWLWPLQIAVVCGYSLIILIFMPAYLLHPYTPVVKNLPLICMMALLAVLERR